MSVIYSGEHSVNYGKYNTWDDWHLIPTSRPLISPPNVKTKEVDIPGMDGVLDLTEVLAGRPTYGNRTGSHEFIVANDYWPWSEAYSTIMDILHGQGNYCILSDEPEYFYNGRFSVNQWRSDKNWSTITINYNVNPFKQEVLTSMDDWEWDPFNFRTGVIRNWNNLEVNGSRTIRLIGSRMPSSPAIICSNEMVMEYDGATYLLSQGRNVIPGFKLTQEETDITITGTGTVSIEYRGGRF